jgi:hypothetical protein
MLLLIAVILVLADLITTLVGFRLSSTDSEANPLWRAVIAKYGIGVFALTYLAGMGLIIALSSLAGPTALAGLVAGLGLVVLNNLYALARLLKR